LQGEFSLRLTRNGRTVQQGSRYTFTEMTQPLLARRAAEELRRDRTWFTALRGKTNEQ
jgi:hypothetical protein